MIRIPILRPGISDPFPPVESALREPDGLAMSSRNAYLKPDERIVAGRMNLILKDTATRLKHGDSVNIAEAYASSALLEAGFNSVDYVAVRDAESLSPISDVSRPARILAAAKIGTTRLIDNLGV